MVLGDKKARQKNQPHVPDYLGWNTLVYHEGQLNQPFITISDRLVKYDIYVFTQRKRGTKTVPWGTILEIGTFFYKKGIENVQENSALLQSGTKTVPQKVPFYGRSNGAPRAPFWYHLFFFECYL